MVSKLLGNDDDDDDGQQVDITMMNQSPPPQPNFLIKNDDNNDKQSNSFEGGGRHHHSPLMLNAAVSSCETAWPNCFYRLAKKPYADETVAHTAFSVWMIHQRVNPCRDSEGCT